MKRKVLESSDSNIEEEPTADEDDDGSDLEDFEPENDIEGETVMNTEDFVVVKYATKKTWRHFIGQIVKVEEGGYSTHFLKKCMNSSSNFVFPDERDYFYIIS